MYTNNFLSSKICSISIPRRLSHIREESFVFTNYQNGPAIAASAFYVSRFTNLLERISRAVTSSFVNREILPVC